MSCVCAVELQGNGSGDEADVVLDDVPDDDEYDTEDSFIDDTELVSTALLSICYICMQLYL